MAMHTRHRQSAPCSSAVASTVRMGTRTRDSPRPHTVHCAARACTVPPKEWVRTLYYGFILARKGRA
eukprot:5849362-Prymnesium_polylepis.1